HVGGFAAGVLVAPFLRPRLLADSVPSWWEPTARAVPSLLLLVGILYGRVLLVDLLPPLRLERDDAWGLSVPVPSAWRPGANRFGQLAFFNGLPGVGRATFAAGASVGEDAPDVEDWAERFIEEQLQPGVLGPHVLRVSHHAPVAARIGDRDALLVRADVDERFGRTKLLAWFVPRGNVMYQLVFSYPEAYPRYAHVIEKMVEGIRFGEPRELREARAAALLFPNASWALGRLGSVMQTLGEPHAAADLLSAAVRAEPGAVTWRAQLARALLQSGEIEAGCRAARDAVLYGPQDAQALEAAARCELARGNPVAAMERLSEALKSAPNDARLLRARDALRVTMEQP
ncbi:MAG: rhomboid family intramembrane serine protease, partial [Myxococcaceae bacterium]